MIGKSERREKKGLKRRPTKTASAGCQSRGMLEEEGDDKRGQKLETRRTGMEISDSEGENEQ